MLSGKLKILMLAIEPPIKEGLGGERRTCHFVKALAEYGELTLAILDPRGERLPDRDAVSACRQVFRATDPEQGTTAIPASKSRIRNWFRTISVFVMPWRNHWSEFLAYVQQYCSCGNERAPRSASWSKRLLSFLLDVEFRISARFFSLPTMSTFYYADAFRRMKPRLIEAAKRDSFDVIWVEHNFIFPFAEELLREIGRPLIVCNTHNVYFQLFERHAELAKNKIEKRYWTDQARLAKRIEARTFRVSDLVIVCSEQDQALALDLVPNANTVVIGNGVDADNTRPSYPRALASVPTILLTGTFSYKPNVDSVAYFVNEIFTLIKQSVPTCRFVVAGYMAQQAMDEAGIRDDAMSYVTSPDDMRPLFDQAWAFVVPLRVGGGTRLKILEAMAMEVPVVSTRVGAEGVPYRDGEHILLADSPHDFAAAVVKLLSDTELRTRLASQAAQFVRKNYDWKSLCDISIIKLQEMVDMRTKRDCGDASEN